MKKPLLALAAYVALALNLIAADAPKMAAAEAAKLVAAGKAVLVDIREPSEWKESGVAAPAVLNAFYRATGRSFTGTTLAVSAVRALAFDGASGDLVATRGLSPLGSVRVLRPSAGAPLTFT